MTNLQMKLLSDKDFADRYAAFVKHRAKDGTKEQFLNFVEVTPEERAKYAHPGYKQVIP